MISSKDYPSRRLDSWLYFTAERACPGVSLDMIRHLLKKLRGEKVECLGHGHQARWQRKSNRQST